MTLDEIKDQKENGISVEKLSFTTLDEGAIFNLELITDNPDLPIKITSDSGSEILIPNRDIPQFIHALAMMCNENYA